MKEKYIFCNWCVT